MEYELFPPPNWDPSVPTSFLVSVSGVGGQHINGFSRRLPHGQWVVAVPLRPEDSELFFEGCGAEGDGLWHLREFCRHLSEEFAVETNRFLMVGVSNGGNAVVRFATHWPELCRGLIIVTCGISGRGEDLHRLQGIPIDMYVGSADECGFYDKMTSLEAALRHQGQSPPASLTIFEDAPHCCSPLVDQHLVMARMLVMLLNSGPIGRHIKLGFPDPGVLSSDEITARVRGLCEDLGLEHELDASGSLAVRATEVHLRSVLRSQSSSPSVFFVRMGRPSREPSRHRSGDASTPTAAAAAPRAPSPCTGSFGGSMKVPAPGVQAPLQLPPKLPIGGRRAAPPRLWADFAYPDLPGGVTPGSMGLRNATPIGHKTPAHGLASWVTSPQVASSPTAWTPSSQLAVSPAIRSSVGFQMPMVGGLVSPNHRNMAELAAQDVAGTTSMPMRSLRSATLPQALGEAHAAAAEQRRYRRARTEHLQGYAERVY